MAKFTPVKNYLKNVTKSMAFVAVDVAKSDLAPDVIDFAESNKEVFVTAFSFLKNPPTTIKRGVKAFQESKVYQAIDYTTKNFFEDLRTGNFYNKEREERDSGRLSGMNADDWNDLSEFGIDDDFEKNLDRDIDNEDKPSAGDKLVSGSVEDSAAAATVTVSNAIVGSADSINKNNRANTAMLYTQNEKLMTAMHHDVTAVGMTVSAMHNMQSEVLKNIDTNMSGYFTNSLKLMTENNAILKELIELQRNVYKSAADKEKEEAEKRRSNNKMRWGDISSGGMPDLGNYFEAVKGNIRKEIKALGLPDFGGGEEANTLATFGIAPIRDILKWVVGGVIPSLVKDATMELNNTLTGVFGTLIARLGEAKNNNDNPILSKLAKFLGVNIGVNRSIDTTKYDRGPVPFDGITRKTIVEVIPRYLRRIESALTGNPEELFDHVSGRWMTGHDVKKAYDNIKKSGIRSGTSEIREAMKKNVTLLRNGYIANGDQKKLDEFDAAVDKFYELLYQNPTFNEYKDKRENGMSEIRDEFYEPLMAAFRNMGAVRDKSGRIVARNYSARTRLAGNILSARDAEEKQYRALEEQVGSALKAVMAEGGFSGLDKNGNWKKLDEFSDKEEWKTGGHLLVMKDKQGNTVFDYLQNINKELKWQRHYWFIGGGVGGGTAGPDGNPPQTFYTTEQLDEQFKRMDIEHADQKKEKQKKTDNKNKPINSSAVAKAKKWLEEGKAIDIHSFTEGEQIELANYANQMMINASTDEYNERIKADIESNALHKFFNDNFIHQNLLTRTDIEKFNRDQKRKEEKEDSDKDDGKNLEGGEKKLFDRVKELVTKYGSMGGAIVGASSEVMRNVIYTADQAIYEMLFKKKIKNDEDDDDDEDQYEYDEYGNKVKIDKEKRKKKEYEGLMDMITDKAKTMFEDSKTYIKNHILKPFRDYLGLGEDDKLSEFKDNFKKQFEDIAERAGKMFVEANKDTYGALFDKFKDITGITARQEEKEKQKQREHNAETKQSIIDRMTNKKGLQLYGQDEETGIKGVWGYHDVLNNKKLKKINQQTSSIDFIQNTSENTNIVSAIKDLQKMITEDNAKDEADRTEEYKNTYEYNVLSKELNRALGINSLDQDFSAGGIEKAFSKYFTEDYFKAKRAEATTDDKFNESTYVNNILQAVMNLTKNANKEALDYHEQMKAIAEDAGYDLKDLTMAGRNLDNARNAQRAVFNTKKDLTNFKEMQAILSDDNASLHDILSTFQMQLTPEEFQSAIQGTRIDENGNEVTHDYEDYQIKNNLLQAISKYSYNDKGNKYNHLDENQLIDLIIERKHLTPEKIDQIRNNSLMDYYNKNGSVTKTLNNEAFKAALRKVLTRREQNVHAEGTMGRPFMGDTMLSRGELLFDSDGMRMVDKTDAYRLDQPTHILNSEDSHDLLAGLGVKNLPPKSTVEQDLAKEEAKARQLFGRGIRTHAEGTGSNIRIKGGPDITLDEAISEGKKYLPETAAGGAFGGLIGLVLGGPILGAAVGVAGSLVKNSEVVKEKLFGKKLAGEKGEKGERDDTGWISKEVTDKARKILPDMTKFGLAGILPGLITPFGPIGGLLIGGAIGYLKNSERFTNKYFGEEGKLSLKSKEKETLQKLLPNAGKGALVGTVAGFIFGGPFGLLGNALLGSAVGMISTTDEFKKMILGEEIDGVRQGGLLGALSEIFDPMKKSLKDFATKLEDIFDKNIVDPLSRFIHPLLTALPYAITAIPKKITELLEKHMGRSLGQFMKQLFKPLGFIGKGAMKLGAGVANVVTSPIRLLGRVGDKLNYSNIKHMRDDTSIAEDRLQLRKRLGKHDDLEALDSMLASMGGTGENDMTLDEAKAIKERLNSISDSASSIHKAQNDSFKEFRNSMESFRDSNGKSISSRKQKAILEALRTHQYDKIPSLLQSAGLKQEDFNRLMGGEGDNDGLQSKLNKFMDLRHREESIKTGEDKTREQAELEDLFRNKLGITNFSAGDAEQVTRLANLFNSEIISREGGHKPDEDKLPTTVEGIGVDVKEVVRLLSEVDKTLKGETTKEGSETSQEFAENAAEKVQEATESTKDFYDKIAYHRTRNYVDHYRGDEPITELTEEQVNDMTGGNATVMGSRIRKLAKVGGSGADLKYLTDHKDYVDNRGLLALRVYIEPKAKDLFMSYGHKQRRQILDIFKKSSAYLRKSKHGITEEDIKFLGKLTESERKRLINLANEAVRSGEYRIFNTYYKLYKMNSNTEDNMKAGNHVENEETAAEYLNSLTNEAGRQDKYNRIMSGENVEEEQESQETATEAESNAYGTIARNGLGSILFNIGKGALGLAGSAIGGIGKGIGKLGKNAATGVSRFARNKASDIGAWASTLGTGGDNVALRDKVDNGGGEVTDVDNDGVVRRTTESGETIEFKEGQDGSLDANLSNPGTKNYINRVKKDREEQSKFRLRIMDMANTVSDTLGGSEGIKDKGKNLLSLLFGAYLLKKSGIYDKIIRPIFVNAIIPLWTDHLKPWLTKKVWPWVTDKVVPWVTNKFIDFGSFIINKAIPALVDVAKAAIGELFEPVLKFFGTTLDKTVGEDKNVSAKNEIKAKNYEDNEVTNLVDENGNALTGADIKNHNYKKLYNANGQKAKVDENGNIYFKDKSFHGEGYLGTAMNEFVRGFTRGTNGGIIVDIADYLGSKMSKKGIFGKAAGVIEKALTAPSSAGAALKQAATSQSDNVVKSVMNKIKEILSKITQNSKVAKRIAGLGKGAVRILEKISRLIEEHLPGMIYKITKKSATESAKLAAKASSRLTPATIAFLIADFITGCDQAESILEVTQTNILQEIVCGLISAILGFFIITIPLIKPLCKLICKHMDKNFKDKEQQAKDETEEYNRKNGTTLTTEEYLKKQYSVTGKIGGKFKDWVGKSWRNIKTSINKNKNEPTAAAGLAAQNLAEMQSNSSLLQNTQSTVITVIPPDGNASMFDQSAQNTATSIVVTPTSGTMFGSGTNKWGRGYSKQIDPSISNMPFNAAGDTEKQTIGDSACGPAAAVNVIESFGRGKSSNKIANASKYAINNGYKEVNGGTKPGFFKDYFAKNGYDSETTQSVAKLEENINAGMPTVLMGKDARGTSADTPFGKTPHYVTVTGTDGKGHAIVQDPESKRDNQLYGMKDLMKKTQFGVSAYGKGKWGRGGENYDTPIAQQVYAFLTASGYTPAAAAGIMGNLYQESTMNPGAIQGGGKGPAAGIAQWENYSTKSSRWANLKKFADERGTDWTDLDTQLNFLMSEMPETEYFMKLTDPTIDEYDGNKAYNIPPVTLEEFKKNTNPLTAALQFEKGFERASQINFPRRLEAASNYYNLYSGKTIEYNGEIGAVPMSADSTTGTTTGSTSDSVSDTTGGIIGMLSNVLSNSVVGKIMSAFTGTSSSSSTTGSNAYSSAIGGSTTAGGVGGDPKKLLDVAAGEIGYHEEGTNLTKYGKWYNLDGQPWCAMFVSWAANQAGIPENVIPKYSLTTAGFQQLYNLGAKNVKPSEGQPGDIAFFSHDGTSGQIYHTGIVESVGDGKINTIEGNTSDQVARRSYDSNSSQILVMHPNYPDTEKYMNAAQASQEYAAQVDASDPNANNTTTNTSTGLDSIPDYANTRGNNKNKPMARYGTFTGNLYGRGIVEKDKSVRLKTSEGSVEVEESVGDQQYNKSAKNNTKYGKGSEQAYNKVLESIVKILMTIADNTDKLNMVVDILKDKLGVNITASDIANNTGNSQSLKSKVAGSMGMGSGSNSNLIQWDNKLENGTFENVMSAMSAIAAE